MKIYSTIKKNGDVITTVLGDEYLIEEYDQQYRRLKGIVDKSNEWSAQEVVSRKVFAKDPAKDFDSMIVFLN